MTGTKRTVAGIVLLNQAVTGAAHHPEATETQAANHSVVLTETSWISRLNLSFFRLFSTDYIGSGLGCHSFYCKLEVNHRMI